MPRKAGTRPTLVASTPEPKESKRDKFRRLANRRASIAIKYIRMLGPLAGPDYERDEGDVDKLERRLVEEVEKVIVRLRKPKDDPVESIL